jgi:deoxyribodipyrimidine photo-lyase
MTQPVLLWLRQDIRLHDQPALVAAAQAGPVIPVYVLDDQTPGDWRIGGAQRWYLHYALATLARAFENKGSRLILRRGEAVAELHALMQETGATAVHAIRHYEPWWRKAESELGDLLCLHDGNNLARIEDVTTGEGKPFRVYSSFYKALTRFLPPDAPVPVPDTIAAPRVWPQSDALADWALLPTRDWADAFGDTWKPGEDAALAAVTGFARHIDAYDTTRNLPSVEGSARLSAYLHFGEISPRQVWHALPNAGEGVETFRKEIAWRDFTSGVVMAMPDYAHQHGRSQYDKLPYRTGPEAERDLKAWRRGRTGYPIVDAGMRQLWTTGWMHNRVRMIAASFLTKHLLLDWRHGERWFWDTLVDADYGNNAVNWQWVAGTGIDANMFGRIMAPLSQSEKFGAGDYIRRWVPELGSVPDPAIHDPEAAGSRPRGYPAKIIGHREARERALAAGAMVR